MKRALIWLVKLVDPKALILWDLSGSEYAHIRELMAMWNHQRSLPPDACGGDGTYPYA